MLFRRTSKLVELEAARRNADKAKPPKKAAVSVCTNVTKKGHLCTIVGFYTISKNVVVISFFFFINVLSFILLDHTSFNLNGTVSLQKGACRLMWVTGAKINRRIINKYLEFPRRF